MKKFFATFFVLCMLALPVHATSLQLTMGSAEVVTSATYDAPLKTQEIEAPTFTINGRTMVPVRAVAENFGAQVGWDDPVVTVTKGETVIQLTVDSTTATVNGQAVTLDAAATVINGRTFVPLCFIGEAFGYTVKWVSSTQRILITDSPVVAKAGSTVMTFEELYFYIISLTDTDGVSSAAEFLDVAKMLCSVYAYEQQNAGMTEEIIEVTKSLALEMQSEEEFSATLPVISEAALESILTAIIPVVNNARTMQDPEAREQFVETYYNLAQETCPAELLIDAQTLESLLAERGIVFEK